jgi:hypothetical protein
MKNIIQIAAIMLIFGILSCSNASDEAVEQEEKPEEIEEVEEIEEIEDPDLPCENKICNVDNPLTDLAWMKEMFDKNIVSASKIYQCTYKDGIGFIFLTGSMGFFYNCAGEMLCILGGSIGATCPDLNIDIENKKLIWWQENGFEYGICEFDNPLENLLWLTRIVEELTVYSNVFGKRHFRIYECTYIEEGDEKVGFIVTPRCFRSWDNLECYDNHSTMYRCTGRVICSTMWSGADDCNNFDITNKKLIWEINNPY